MQCRRAHPLLFEPEQIVGRDFERLAKGDDFACRRATRWPARLDERLATTAGLVDNRAGPFQSSASGR
jgi:hypothetical protein